MMAYSSIAHAGYMLVGLSVAVSVPIDVVSTQESLIRRALS